jgi:hypothetical protein
LLVRPATRPLDVDAGPISPELGDAMRPPPFDFSPGVTYNLALDASFAGSKRTPLIADLTPNAAAMKEYLYRFGTPNLPNT